MEIIHYVRTLIREYLEDLKKQCIVLMGLTAAGKSTFVKTKLKKLIPNADISSVVNSDIQLVAMQHKTALLDWGWLQSITNFDDFVDAVRVLTYIRNDGTPNKHTITWDWLEHYREKPFINYWKTFKKSFYAEYFDIRDLAIEKTKELSDGKLYKGANTIIFDGTAINVEKTQDLLRKTKNNGFTNTIIYLDVNPNLSIERDIYRGKTMGRTVGKNVILSLAKRIGGAFSSYLHISQDPNPVIDRIIHFKWVQFGNSPIDGAWKLVGDYRTTIKRKITSNE